MFTISSYFTSLYYKSHKKSLKYIGWGVVGRGGKEGGGAPAAAAAEEEEEGEGGVEGGVSVSSSCLFGKWIRRGLSSLEGAEDL